MLMPTTKGYRYLVHAHDTLTSWPEAQVLKHENASTLGEFIFEHIICRWGALLEIVTDDGLAFIKVETWLRDKYDLHHICIMPYNSKGNAPVERRHCDVREVLLKVALATKTLWCNLVHTTMWCEQISTQRATGHTPFWMATGTEPILPFNIDQATYLLPVKSTLSNEDLIARRIQALMLHDSDLEDMPQHAYQTCIKVAHRWADSHACSIDSASTVGCDHYQRNTRQTAHQLTTSAFTVSGDKCVQ
jgi:hypothetical protein